MSRVLIGEGHVYHKRHGPSENQFRYPLFFFFFKCAEEPVLQSQLQKGLWKAYSLNVKDYLQSAPGTFDIQIKTFLRERCGYEAEEVWLQTFPRMLGYVFNPISFWVCKKHGVTEAVLCEVSNTFGERHYYWIHPPHGIEKNEWLTSQKVFHVSPFFPVEGSYKFRFNFSDEKTQVDILYYDKNDQLVLTTGVRGDLTALEQKSPFAIILRYGWMTPLVIFRIHFQALRLWVKKAKFYSKPPPPSKEITS